MVGMHRLSSDDVANHAQKVFAHDFLNVFFGIAHAQQGCGEIRHFGNFFEAARNIRNSILGPESLLCANVRRGAPGSVDDSPPEKGVLRHLLSSIGMSSDPIRF